MLIKYFLQIYDSIENLQKELPEVLRNGINQQALGVAEPVQVPEYEEDEDAHDQKREREDDDGTDLGIDAVVQPYTLPILAMQEY